MNKIYKVFRIITLMIVFVLLFFMGIYAHELTHQVVNGYYGFESRVEFFCEGSFACCRVINTNSSTIPSDLILAQSIVEAVGYPFLMIYSILSTCFYVQFI